MSAIKAISGTVWIEEKGSRNKRKFISDPPLVDLNKALNECEGYEFSTEIAQNIPTHGLCKMCHCNPVDPDDLKLELGLSCPVEPCEVEFVRDKVEQESKGIQDADWSDLTESQFEELCLNNLDSIFKSAVKMIVASGYSEDVAAKAVLRADLCYGCKDTVSNIVDNTLAILQSGQEIDASGAHFFENLEQLEKYILVEMVCVLKEVNPLFNTGDAMWCLLICDMNVSQACAMDGDSLSFLGSNEASGDGSAASLLPEMDSKGNSSEANPSNSDSPHPGHNNVSQTDLPSVKGIPNLPNPKNSLAGEERPPEKASPTSTSNSTNKTQSAVEERAQAKPQPSSSAEKPVGGRKAQPNGAKRESLLRQKIQLEKNYRGALRTGKLSGLGGLFLDKKLKSVSDSISIHPKNASMKIKKTMEVKIAQADGSHHVSVTVGTSTSVSSKKTVNTPPVLPKAKTEPPLSSPSKSNATPNITPPSSAVLDCSHYGIQYDKTTGKWMPNDKQDEVIIKLVSKAQDLQSQLGEWTNWANQKVMQATRRLGKDKAELNVLRQEKDEVERIQKERQQSEENTMRKLSEMQNALSKATIQVEQADCQVRKLEKENAKLRLGMEEAKKRSTEATESCNEVSKRENKITKKLQSSEGQKASLQEELTMLKGRNMQLEQDIEQNKKLLKLLEARQKQVKKEKGEILALTESIKKEKEQIEASTKLEENRTRAKSTFDLQRRKDDIRDLETKIFRLKLKADPSKIGQIQIQGQGQTSYISELNAILQESLQTENVKRDRECVMCLTEEMSVIFLPCAHQVVCTKCNELHVKQGMKDCPSCRTPIQQRICARFYR